MKFLKGSDMIIGGRRPHTFRIKMCILKMMPDFQDVSCYKERT